MAMDKTSLPVCVRLFADSAEQTLNASFPLPDALADMGKIVYAFGDARVDEVTPTDGGTSLHALLTLRVQYLADPGETPKTAVFHTEATHVFDTPSFPADGVFFKPDCRVLQVIAKLSGPRDADLRAQLLFSLEVRQCGCESLLPADAPGLVLHEASAEAAAIKPVGTSGEIRKELTLDAGLPGIADIVNTAGSLRLENVRVGEEALAFDGVLDLRLTYRGESEGDRPVYTRIEESIPFSGEIIDTFDPESCRAVAFPTLTTLDADVSFDPYGENRVITVSAAYDALFDVLTPVTAVYADDAFLAGVPSEAVIRPHAYEAPVTELRERFALDEKTGIDASRFASVDDASLSLVSYGTGVAGGETVFSAKALFSVRGVDKDGRLCAAGAVLPLRKPLSAKIPPESSVTAGASVSGVRAVIRAGELLCEGTVSLDGVVTEKKTLYAVESVTALGEGGKAESAVIFCYPHGGESVWDVAKRYGVSPEVIRGNNGLAGDSPIGDAPLLIRK